MQTYIFSKRGYCNFFWVLYFFISDLSKFLDDFGISRVISYVIFILFMCVYLYIERQRITPVDVLIQLFFAIIAVYGLLNNAEYIEDRKRVYAIIINFIPAYYLFRMASFESMNHGLKYAAFLSGLYMVYSYVTEVHGASGYDMNYDMNYSRGCALPSCVMFYYFVHERKYLFLVLSLFLFATSFLAGSRSAPMLTLMCFIIFILAKMKKSKLGVLSIASFFSFLVVVWFKLEWILIDVLGLESSRNVAKFVSGQYMVSHDREELYNEIIVHLSANPTGYGPLGSRRILNLGGYPHSLYYELQLDFGIYLGIALFVLFMVMAAYLVFVYYDDELAPLVIPLCVVGLGVLMVSTSYYHDYTVPAIVALFIRLIFVERKKLSGFPKMLKL